MSHSQIITDSEKARDHAHIAMALKQEQLTQWCAFHRDQERLIDDEAGSVNNWERQQGRVMKPDELEKLLLKINPAFRFEHIETWDHLPTVFKRLILPPSDTMVYHNFPMPEYSWFNTKTEEVYDPSLLPRVKTAKGMSAFIDRKDLPAGEVVVKADGTLDYVWDTSKPRPGYRFVKKPWNEKVRGWRTILRRLVEGGWATIDQVERLAPSQCDRASWAVLKQASATSPF